MRSLQVPVMIVPPAGLPESRAGTGGGSETFRETPPSLPLRHLFRSREALQVLVVRRYSEQAGERHTEVPPTKLSNTMTNMTQTEASRRESCICAGPP